MVDWTKLAYCGRCCKYKDIESLVIISPNCKQKKCPSCKFAVRMKPRNSGNPVARYKQVYTRY